MTNCFLALDALLTRYLNLYKETDKSLPYVEFDEAWASPCIVESASKSGAYYWKPVARQEQAALSDLEKALEIDFHPDIKTFYGSFWSNGICVDATDINFNLIQSWNPEDETRLKENLLGHAFAKIKSRLPLSFFIGCTNGNEIICLEQDSGQIVLERPGFKAHQVLADNLESFLISLQPTTDVYNL